MMRDKWKANGLRRRTAAVLIIGLLTCQAALAQLTEWVMRPSYDSIHLAAGVPVIVGDSAGTRVMFDINGRRLASTTDFLAEFSDGMAVAVSKGTTKISGFYTPDGKFTSVEGHDVAYGYPYFADGWLLTIKKGRCRLVDKQGNESDMGLVLSMYPYNNGYACCSAYGDVEKMSDIYYYYVDTARNHVRLLDEENKEVDAEDVAFLSSVNDDGLGVAVVKRRVYFFDKSLGALRPVYVDDKAGKKRQARINGDLEENLATNRKTTRLTAFGSKKDTVTFLFDAQMKLMNIKYPTRVDSFKRVVKGPVQYPADYTAGRAADGLYALKRNGREVLPAQFEDVGIRLGRMAAVRTRGKWGMLAVYDSLKYTMSMNKGNAVAFRHEKFETTVRMNLPAMIKADNCGFDIDPASGCTIDKTSIETRNTPNGNYVQYNCVLTIPDSLPDHITEVVYPVKVTCDGVTYPDDKITVEAWHYKYVNVDLSRNETKLAQGNIEFTINIQTEKIPGENDYPLTVEVVEDSTVRAELEKLSETRYKCRMYSLAEGINKVTIKVSESGCPPSLFPFEINYTKPAGSHAGGRKNGGQVEITTKNSDGSTQSSGITLPDTPPQDAAAPADSVSTAPVMPAAAPADNAQATAPAATTAAPAAPAASAGNAAKAAADSTAVKK